MKLFCDVCKNLLEIDIINDMLMFHCASCSSNYESSPDDSLRYEEYVGHDIQIYTNILKKISDDAVNPKIYRECKKCKHNIAKYVRLGENKKIIYGCEKCKEVDI